MLTLLRPSGFDKPTGLLPNGPRCSSQRSKASASSVCIPGGVGS